LIYSSTSSNFFQFCCQAQIVCTDGNGQVCSDRTVPQECPPAGIIEKITFSYFVENNGSEPIKIDVANSHVNDGPAIDFLSYIETNPVSSGNTTAFSTFGEVAVNICFPLRLTNTLTVEGVSSEGTTCVDEVTSAFAILPVVTQAGWDGK
jgi:hypothetical protein